MPLPAGQTITSQQSEVPGHSKKCRSWLLAVPMKTHTPLRAVVMALGSTAALLPPVGHNTVMKALPHICRAAPSALGSNDDAREC